MQLLPEELVAASCAARERLDGLARSTAAENTTPRGSAGTQAAMASAARAAIFADALLGALRARLDEFKALTK